MKKKRFYLAFIFLLFSFILFSQNGKLDKAKESLKNEKTTTSTTVKTSRSASPSGRNLFADDVNLFIQIFGYLFAYTAYGIAFESPWEQ
ncbi:MAG: hypothetical protein GW785_01460, partial [Flavobacteriia bacterium]|nr:hypothetical protein [Flavobacteriia bacterium]